MCDIAGPCDAGWAEALPTDCPLAGSTDPAGRTLYRLFEGSTLRPEDFWSHRKLGKSTGNACECRAVSVSLVNSLPKARKKVKLPRFKGQRIAEVPMTSACGPIYDPKNSGGHVDWWPCSGFDVMAVANEVV